MFEMEEEMLAQQNMLMLMMDPPRHTRYRLLVSRAFTPRNIRVLEEYIDRTATEIVDNVIERGECDFVTDLAAELPLQVIAEMMGVPQQDRKLIFDWSNRMIGSEDPEFAPGRGRRRERDDRAVRVQPRAGRRAPRRTRARTSSPR